MGPVSVSRPRRQQCRDLPQGVEEQRSRVHAVSRPLLDCLRHAQRQQRVAAKLEEIVFGRNPLDRKNRLPDLGDHLLSARGRRVVADSGARRRSERLRQRATIHLTVWS